MKQASEEQLDLFGLPVVGPDHVRRALPTRLAGSLAAARNEFQLRIDNGGEARCPCCDRTARRYRRSLHVAMVVALIRLHKLDEKKTGYYDVHDWGYMKSGGSGDYAKLRFWGLILPVDSRTYTENASGLWRITPLGKDFVSGSKSIPKYVYLFDNEKVGESEEKISIQQALGDKFDYRELMESP